MAERTNREAILAAAQRAVIERGPGKLTLSAVADAAGVSRPTLYRWFPTKDDLLAALAVHLRDRFDVGVQAVIDAQSTPNRKLDAALRFLVTYLDGTMGDDPIGADPASSLRSMSQSLVPQSETLVRQLGDALDRVPAVRVGALTRQQAAEMFLRLAFSHYLFPHPEPEVLLTAMRRFAGLDGRSIIRAAG